MMRAKTEQRVKRWSEQRWVLDSVIQAIGMEWDQPRLIYTLAPCGPDAMGDFRGVGMRVRKFADMHRELAAAARRREMRAEQFEAQGRTVSAGESYFIASLLWSAARWPIFENNETSIRYNTRTVACYDKYAKYATHPVIRIEVPFGRGKVLPGYLHLPREPRKGEKFPCVIAVDGMDGSKEILCSIYGDKFLERGFASFIYDGPGQGECTYNGVWVTSTNHMDAARAVYDALAKHPNIDTSRLVATGVSFGSYFGLQVAASLGDQLKGVAVSMVCHEPGANAIFNMASPSFKMRFMYMAGIEDERKFDAFMRKITLAPQLPRIKCPVLIQGGEDDELSPIEFSHALVDKIRAPKKFVVYEGERHAVGGGTASQLGENWYTMLVDWCLDRINGKKPPNEYVHINSLGQANVTAYK